MRILQSDWLIILLLLTGFNDFLHICTKKYKAQETKLPEGKCSFNVIFCLASSIMVLVIISIISIIIRKFLS